MEHNSGIQRIVNTTKADFNLLMEGYKPRYITAAGAEGANSRSIKNFNVSTSSDKATVWVDDFMLDSYRFPKETKNIITNSNRLIKEAGGLKNMTVDQLAKDPDALLGLFLKNRKMGYDALQSGWFNKGVAFVEVGGIEHVLIRRNGWQSGQRIQDAIKTMNLKNVPSSAAQTTHVVEVKEVGTYVKGMETKNSAVKQAVPGWMDDGTHAADPYIRTKDSKITLYDDAPNPSMYIEIQPRLHGKSIANMTSGDLGNIANENMQLLLSDISKSKKAGIQFDQINPNNYLFNPKTGQVGMIDLEAQTAKQGTLFDRRIRNADYVKTARSITGTMYKSILDDIAKNSNMFSEMEQNRILGQALEKSTIYGWLENMRVVLESNPKKAQILRDFNRLSKTITNSIKKELKLLGVTPLLIPNIIGEPPITKDENKQ